MMETVATLAVVANALVVRVVVVTRKDDANEVAVGWRHAQAAMTAMLMPVRYRAPDSGTTIIMARIL